MSPYDSIEPSPIELQRSAEPWRPPRDGGSRSARPGRWSVWLALALAGSLLLVGALGGRGGERIATIEESRSAYEAALTSGVEGEDALIMSVAYAELLELSGDVAAASATYARVAELDPHGPWGRQARRRMHGIGD